MKKRIITGLVMAVTLIPILVIDALLPLFQVVAAIFVCVGSYEIIKFAGKSKSRFVKILTMPGLWLQKITTREPDDSQLEVAISSLLVLQLNGLLLLLRYHLKYLNLL